LSCELIPSDSCVVGVLTKKILETEKMLENIMVKHLTNAAKTMNP